ncbi:MAG: hypothetical protein IT353_09895 [Gemmatimonadaceae bacterium]|nr:hypothetical protein [Gemmatimonadaceae bacterium]
MMSSIGLRRCAAVLVLAALGACEQADQFAGGIDLDSPPPSIGADMKLHTPREDVDAPAVASRASGDVPTEGAPSAEPRAVAPEAASAAEPSTTPAPRAADVSARPAAPTAPAAIAPRDSARVSTVVATRATRERAPILLAADRAFATRSGCSEAVRAYSSFPKPSDLSGPDGADWVTAQLRIAQCSMELREWARSLEAIANVKAARTREWSAPYFEGHVYCQMGQFERGTKAFRDMSGLLGTLSTGARQAVTLLSKYGMATCDRLDYEVSRQPERNRDQLELFLGEYEEFLTGAERLQSGSGFPAEYAREFASALKSARDHVNKYGKS